MKSRIYLFLLICTFCLPCSGQTDSLIFERELDSLLSIWAKKNAAGEYEAVLASIDAVEQQALEKIGKRSPNFASLVLAHGQAYFNLGRYAEAEPLLLEAASLREAAHGRQSGEVGTALNAVGRLYLETGDFEKAGQYFGESAAIAEQVFGKMHLAYASSINNLGISFYYRGQYEQVAPLWLEAKAIREKLLGKEHPAYAGSLGNLANLYADLGQYEKAEPLYLESLSITEKKTGKDHPDYAVDLSNLAILYKEMGRYGEAIKATNGVIAIREKSPGKDHPDYGTGLSTLAGIYMEQGKFEAAKDLYHQTLAVYAKALGEEAPMFAGSLNDLANAYNRLGQYDLAERNYLRSLELREKTLGKDHPEYAWSLNNLAVLYFHMANYDKAESLHLEALAIREKVLGKEHPHYGASLNSLAVVYQYAGKPEKAVPLMLQGIEISRTTLGPDHPGHAGNLVNLAGLYADMRRFDDAERLFKEAIAIFKNKQLESHYYHLNALSGLANVFYETGRYLEAEHTYLTATDLQEKNLGPNHPTVSANQFQFAKLHWKTGQPERAVPHLRVGNAMGNATLANASKHLSETEMQCYIQSHSAQSDLLFSFVSQPGPAQTALHGSCYDQALFHKGFLLNAALLIQNETRLASQGQFLEYRACQRQLARLYALPAAERDGQALADLETRANALEKELARSASGFGEAIRQVDWQAVQAALRPDEAAIEFVHFRYRNPDPTDSVIYAALLLRPGLAQPLFVPLFEEKELVALLPPASKNRSEFVSQLYQNPALTALVLGQVEPHLKGVKKIFHAPTGLLHRLNLNALPVGAEGQTLAEKYDLVRIGSTRQLALGAEKPELANGGTALVFGAIEYEMDTSAIAATEPIGLADETRGLAFYETDPALRPGGWKFLKHSEKETANVVATLTHAGRATTLRHGYAASEESFKKMGMSGSSPQVLHLSTHGFFFPDPQTGNSAPPATGGAAAFRVSDHPMIRSGLILAGANHAWTTGRPLGNREDGILTAYEISQLDLRSTELVVLAACETGLGDLRGNEGVYGLQRAFKVAGAKKLIMSLWQVPDFQTQELMTLFYQKWLMEQMSIRQALQSAQNELKSRGYEPFYWAGFVLVE